MLDLEQMINCLAGQLFDRSKIVTAMRGAFEAGARVRDGIPTSVAIYSVGDDIVVRNGDSEIVVYIPCNEPAKVYSFKDFMNTDHLQPRRIF